MEIFSASTQIFSRPREGERKKETLELETKCRVEEVTEKASIRAFSWFEASTSNFTFKQDTIMLNGHLNTVSRCEIESC